MSERLRQLWERYRIHLIGAAIAVLVAGGVAAKAFEHPPPTLAEPLATATPAPTELLVDVEGAVIVPGVHSLPPNSLIDDALAAAGGLMPEADLDRVAREVNRSDKLKAHQKLYIPFVGERTVANTLGTAGAAGGSDGSSGELVNLNTATAEQLDTLPGVGPSTAKKIIDYREEHGGFNSVEDLNEVSGIGDVTFEKLKDLVTV